MTQANLFKTEESKKAKKLEEQKQETLKIWRRNSKNFRTLPIEYQILLEKKRELKITPIRPVNKSVLTEYPVVPFFELPDEDAAMRQIDKWAEDEVLDIMLDDLKDLLKTNQPYNMLKSWITDCLYLIAMREYKEDMKRALHPERYTD